MEKTIQDLANVVETQYVYADVGHITAAKIREIIGSPAWKQYLKNENASILLRYINCLLLACTNDHHFMVYLPGGMMRSDPDPSGIMMTTKNYVRFGRLASFIDPDVRMRYVEVFAKLQDHVIIDLRNCSGGSPETALFILSHFFPDGTSLMEIHARDQPPAKIHALSTIEFYESYNTIKKFSGKVYVIINGSTSSSAEVIALVIQSLKRGTIYGSPTTGMLHITAGINLGTLIADIPFATVVDPNTGTDWEGIGATPDYNVESAEFVDFMYKRVVPQLNSYTVYE